MEGKYVYLMSAYNKIEAENIAGILEIEGIDSRVTDHGREEFINVSPEGESGMDIYVPGHAYDAARRVIEVEMVRGDF